MGESREPEARTYLIAVQAEGFVPLEIVAGCRNPLAPPATLADACAAIHTAVPLLMTIPLAIEVGSEVALRAVADEAGTWIVNQPPGESWMLVSTDERRIIINLRTAAGLLDADIADL